MYNYIVYILEIMELKKTNKKTKTNPQDMVGLIFNRNSTLS